MKKELTALIIVSLLILFLIGCKAPEEPAPEEKAPEVEQKALADLKALVEEQAKELKAIKESPVFKSTLSDKPKKVEEKSITGTLDLIR